MRMLHTSDWHLGCDLHGHNRTDELFRQVERVCRIAKGNAVDVLLIAGDIFEQRKRTHEVTKRLARTLTPYVQDGLHVVMMPGNHDHREHFRMMNALLSVEGAKERVHVVTQNWDVFDVKGVQFAIVPYPDRDELSQYKRDETDNEQTSMAKYNTLLSAKFADMVRYVATKKLDSTRPAVFATHISIEGIDYSSGAEATYDREMTLARNDLPTNVSYIALGHIHKSQQIKHAVPCWYSGSFDRMDMGEREEKQKFVLLVEVDGIGPAQVEPIEIPATSFYEIEVLSSEFDSLPKRYSEDDRACAFVRFLIERDSDDDRVSLHSRARNMFKRCVGVSFKNDSALSAIAGAPSEPKNLSKTVMDYLEEKYKDDADLPKLKECAEELIAEVLNGAA